MKSTSTKISAAVAVAVLFLPGCTDGDTNSAAQSTTTASETTKPSTAPATSAPAATVNDRGTPATAAGAQPFSPEACATIDAALAALAIPVNEDGRKASIESTLAALTAAKAVDPGYSTEVLDLLEKGVREETGRMVSKGYAGWQEALVQRRSGADDKDLELQLENYRAYVTPRC